MRALGISYPDFKYWKGLSDPVLRNNLKKRYSAFRFANELFTIWVKGIRQADYLDLLKRARNFVEGIVESSGRNPSRALKERLYNILVNRCSAEGKKRHRELGAQFRDGLSLLWGSEGYAPLNVKEIEKRMEEVRERAQEHGAVDVELADREEGSPDGARVWVSDLTAGLEAVSEEELLVGSWEEWLEEGEGVVMVLREDAGAVMDWYGDQLPEEVRGVLEEELEKRGKDITDAEDAKVAAKKREKQGARGKTPGASAPIGKLVQELEEAHDGLSRKGGAVDRAMEAPWESMKEMWGYPYMEEPWLVDMSRSLEYHGPVAGTIFIGIIQEVLPARGGALVVLEAGNNAPPPVVLDYGFESVPMRFHGKWNKFEKELAKKAPWKAKKGGADGSDSADGSNGADGSFGADGSSGADGSNGADASSGADGSSGADCSNGADASDGADASNGANGTNGSAGLNDVDGSNGVDVSNAAEQVSEAEHGKDGSVAEGEGQNGKENEGENGKAEEENLVSSAVRELERVIEAANSDPTEPSEESVKELLRATIGLYFADSASNTVLDATSDVTRSEGEPSGTKEGASESSSGTPDVTSEASETEGPSGSTTGGMETAGATTGLIEAEGASSTGRGESKSEEASVSASEASGPTVGASETPADASDSEGDASKSAADASDSPAEASDPAAQTSESTAEASGASADTSEAEHETEHTDRQPGSHGPVIYQRHEFLFSKLSGQKCSSELRDTIWAKTKRGQYVLVQVRGPSASGRTWEDGHPMPEVSTTIEISGNHLVRESF